LNAGIRRPDKNIRRSAYISLVLGVVGVPR
jgi:hypothetical protein